MSLIDDIKLVGSAASGPGGRPSWGGRRSDGSATEPGGRGDTGAALSVKLPSRAKHCSRSCPLSRPWFDGAIEQIQGTARVFTPDGPCHECTMSDADWRLLQMRRSCNLLSRSEMAGGKTPTTPTISSIIAGVQSQEAVKLLHGLPTIAGKGWVFDGFGSESYTVELQRIEDCLSHDPLDGVIELDAGVNHITLREFPEEARQELGAGAGLEP